MTATVGMLIALFSGQDLDQWITLAGRWAISDGAMVCQAAPASIRSTFESDSFELTFQYRRSEQGTNRLAIHSKMTTGGPVLLLTPHGLSWPDGKASTGTRFKRDEWIKVRLMVNGQGFSAHYDPPDDQPLKSAVSMAASRSGESSFRGFIRFEATQPGLEIRDVKVNEREFTPLFDGRTLDGWESMYLKNPDDPGWVAEKGQIVCRGQRSGWLRSWRTYDNFVLRLEYQLGPCGNSGIYLRAPIEGRVSQIGLEVQLLDDAPECGRIRPAQHNGAVYDGIAPEVAVPAPVNQWNAIEVLVAGKHIRTTLNGTPLYDARLDDDAKDANAHRRPLTTRRAVGFIGLQDHSSPVRFRNLRIQELAAGAVTSRPGN